MMRHGVNMFLPFEVAAGNDICATATKLWRERGDALISYGFEFGWLGDTLLVLRKVPAIVRSASMSSLLVALQAWLDSSWASAESAQEALLNTLSSHAVPPQLPAYSLSDLNGLLREYESSFPNATERPWRMLGATDWQRLFDTFS